MNKENNKEGQGDALRVIISGGGTGGHIFPAVSLSLIHISEPTRH